MTNFFCGLVAAIIISLFLGGLAHSIWDNTGSIAFPIIIGIVLVMFYVSFFQEVKHGSDNT